MKKALWFVEIVGAVSFVALVLVARGEWLASENSLDTSRMPDIRRTRASEELVAIEDAIKLFRHGRSRSGVTAPPPSSLRELISELGPRAENAILDPWGREYVYRRLEGDGDRYELLSYGADGVPGGSGESADLTVAEARNSASPR